MALTILQSPAYKTLAAESKIVFVVSDPTIVVAQTGVKYKCQVYMSDNSGFVQDLTVLKTTPNNAGSGMFDLRPIVTSYVNSDNLGSSETLTGTTVSRSTFKAATFGSLNPFPLHVIDKYALGVNSMRYLSVIFTVEYLDTTTNAVIDSGQTVQELNYLIYNGVVFNEDPLTKIGSTHNFGYNLDTDNFILNDSNAKFLSNAPTTQYARINDYGTLGFFNQLKADSNSFETAPSGLAGSNNSIYKVELKLYDSTNSQLGSTQNIFNEFANGGSGALGLDHSWTKLLYIGSFPANLRAWNSAFQTHLADISYYTLQAFDDAGTPNAISQLYTINIICDSSKGYEAIRLAWLNKFGAWDYYTFTMKSIKGLTTNRTTYTQLDGTWNDEYYDPYSYKGGQKNFTINAKEKITLNTDFLNNDEESIWMEQLINSNQVYIIKEFDSTHNPITTILYNKYVEPVRVTNSSFTRKTVANDKLIQYKIEIERNKTQRTHTG